MFWFLWFWSRISERMFISSYFSFRSNRTHQNRTCDVKVWGKEQISSRSCNKPADVLFFSEIWSFLKSNSRCRVQKSSWALCQGVCSERSRCLVCCFSSWQTSGWMCFPEPALQLQHTCSHDTPVLLRSPLSGPLSLLSRHSCGHSFPLIVGTSSQDLRRCWKNYQSAEWAGRLINCSSDKWICPNGVNTCWRSQSLRQFFFNLMTTFLCGALTVFKSFGELWRKYGTTTSHTPQKTNSTSIQF